MDRVLVIGSVAAGPKSACHLKRLMPETQITIIDQDDLISYGGCGIPYLIGGEVSDERALRSTSFHMVRDEFYFTEAKGLEIKTKTKALSIQREEKTVLVENLETGEKETLPYDKLILATGSRPNILPIPGSDLKGVFTIGSLNSAIKLQKWLTKDTVEKAVVIGGGAIGIEMAEGLEEMWGLETTIVEYMPQLLPNLAEPVFSKLLETHLKENNISLRLSESVKELQGNDDGVIQKVVTSAGELEADLVIMSTGVRPRDDLAKEAGLSVSPKGGIVVDSRMRTSDPDIYAAGDCVEQTHIVSGKKTYAPLGSLANRQGRVVGDNIAGIDSRFDGIVGTFIMKAFDSSIATTGLTLSAAKQAGFDAASVITIQSDRAHFLPTQSAIPLMIIFDKTSRQVLGVQGFGSMNDAVLARIDAAAGLISRKAKIEDFSNLEMAYAPPFSTAIDALNSTANVADNLSRGRFRPLAVEEFVTWMENPDSNPDWICLDTRAETDAQIYLDTFGDRWMCVPYPEIRRRYHELPKDKTIIIICGAGTRSYEVQVFLDSVSYTNSLVLGGGLMLLRRLGLDWVPDQAVS